MKKVYCDALSSILRKKNPILGSELATFLSERLSIKRVYARKIISLAVRAKLLRSSKPLAFNGRQYAYSRGINSGEFLALADEGDPLKMAYHALKKGPVFKTDLLKLAQAKYLSVSAEKAFDLFLERIKCVLSITQGRYRGVPFFHLSKQQPTEEKLEELYNALKTDAIICAFVYGNLLLTNQVYSAVYRNEDNPGELVGSYQRFDMIGFTRLGCSPENQKHTILVEISISQNLNLSRFNCFKQRVKAFIAKQHNSRHAYKAFVIPVIVTREVNHSFKAKYDPEHQVMWIGLKQLFGKKIEPFLDVLKLGKKAQETLGHDRFFEKIKELAESDFATLFMPFLDELFEAVVNSLIGKLLNLHFVRREIGNPFGEKYEFDGFAESGDSVFAIESKNYARSKVRWEKYNGKKKLSNDCLKYFFEKKADVLSKEFPGKRLFMCFVSRSGFYAPQDEGKIRVSQICPFPVFNCFLLEPQEIQKQISRKRLEGGVEHKWMREFFMKKEPT